MKKYIIFLVMIAAFLHYNVSAIMYTGYLNQLITVAPGQTEVQQLPFASDSLSYINGGLVFTYPAGLFTQAPRVVVTIEKPFTLLSATVIVTANSATSTTVRVVNGSLLSLLEAATGSCTVHLWAVGN